MKRLGKGPDETDKNRFSFQDEEGKSDGQIAEEIATFFSDISANFEPINRSYFKLTPPGAPFVSDVHCLPEYHEVYAILRRSKKTSSVPGDLPIKILKEFLPGLAVPVTQIFIKAISEGVFPTKFKMEKMVPIPKVFPPEDYGDIRPLSMTLFFAKKFEELILRGTATIN